MKSLKNINLDGPECYEFSPFRLDIRGARLFYQDRYVHLTTKAAYLLILLAGNSTNVISKQEIMDNLWPDETVLEQNLTNLVNEVRTALKSNGDHSDYVKTYSGRGYCFEIRAEACDGNHQGQAAERPFKRDGFFNDFIPMFDDLLRSAEEVELFFIHSRRWRMNHYEALVDFVKRDNSLLTIYLPNLNNQVLLDAFKLNFNEGETIEPMIRAAYKDFGEMHLEFSKRVVIRPFDCYPGYSFYRFDEKMIVAMYPNTPGKRGVPTFYVEEGSKYWSFFLRDLETLKEIPPLWGDELANLMA